MSDLDLDAIEARANAALTSPLGQQYDAAVILAADVPALVAEVRRLRERAEAHAVTVQQAVAVERQRDEARAAIAAVRALHVKATRYTSGSSVNTHVPLTADYCVHCGPLLWPCATIRALDVRHDPSATTEGAS